MKHPDILSHRDLLIIDRCLTQGGGSEILRTYKLEALKAAFTVKHKRLQLAEAILRHETNASFSEGEEDIPLLLLSGSETILLLLLSGFETAKECRGYDSDGTLPRLVCAMLQLGAPLDSLDARGNSAIYYCCLHGAYNTFQVLVNAGADTSTLHGEFLRRMQAC